MDTLMNEASQVSPRTEDWNTSTAGRLTGWRNCHARRPELR